MLNTTSVHDAQLRCAGFLWLGRALSGASGVRPLNNGGVFMSPARSVSSPFRISLLCDAHETDVGLRIVETLPFPDD